MSLPVIPFSVLALVYMCGIPAKLAKQNRKKGFLQYTTLVCTATPMPSPCTPEFNTLKEFLCFH